MTPVARPLLLGLLGLLLAATLGAPLAAFEVDPTISRQAFEDFHDRLIFAAYPYPRHAAAPLGLIGFEIYADLSVDPDGDAIEAALDDDLPGDLLSFARVGARKGLPGGIDLGISYGRAAGGDLELVSAEVQWAILDGGALSPALSLRLTGTQSLDSGPYDLDLYGAELLLSKGFTVVTPYVGVGYYSGDGSLERLAGGTFDRRHEATFAYAGVTINLLLPKLTFEVEQGEELQGAVRLAFGF
ncbi:MAG: hypothetical protein AAF604_23910 [Acidobacteriota bacterium]